MRPARPILARPLLVSPGLQNRWLVSVFKVLSVLPVIHHGKAVSRRGSFWVTEVGKACDSSSTPTNVGYKAHVSLPYAHTESKSLSPSVSAEARPSKRPKCVLGPSLRSQWPPFRHRAWSLFQKSEFQIIAPYGILLHLVRLATGNWRCQRHSGDSYGSQN